MGLPEPCVEKYGIFFLNFDGFWLLKFSKKHLINNFLAIWSQPKTKSCPQLTPLCKLWPGNFVKLPPIARDHHWSSRSLTENFVKLPPIAPDHRSSLSFDWEKNGKKSLIMSWNCCAFLSFLCWISRRDSCAFFGQFLSTLLSTFCVNFGQDWLRAFATCLFRLPGLLSFREFLLMAVAPEEESLYPEETD